RPRSGSPPEPRRPPERVSRPSPRHLAAPPLRPAPAILYAAPSRLDQTFVAAVGAELRLLSIAAGRAQANHWAEVRRSSAGASREGQRGDSLIPSARSRVPEAHDHGDDAVGIADLEAGGAVGAQRRLVRGVDVEEEV